MEKKNCYALFIAINTYSDPEIPNLSGCVYDANRLCSYLEQNLNTDLYDLHVEKLYTDSDQLPTRQNIIDSIKSHFSKAAAFDKVILFYSGHGSTEKAHPYFGEADEQVQTLVPCDARTKNAQGLPVKNIIDKELRYLFQTFWKDISEPTQKPDFIFIQDSCHATGATRKDEQLKVLQENLAELELLVNQEEGSNIALPTPIPRYTNPTDHEKSGKDWENLDEDALAKIYTAFDNPDEKPLQKLLSNLDSGAIPIDVTFPLAQQIHFAACGSHEYAYEIPGEGGIFTTNILAILEASQNSISYQDLYNRSKTNIDGVFEQTPDLFIHHPVLQKRHEPFLGDLLKRGELTPYRDVDVFKGFYPVVPKGRSEWHMPVGELKLLPTLDGKVSSIPIEVFLQDSKPTGVTNAEIIFVGSDGCKIKFTTANFDRRKHKDMLYGMIPPRFLRRWRVSVAIGNSNNGLQDWFQHYIKKSNADLYKKGNLALFEIVDSALANYSISMQDNWLHLKDKEGQLVLRASTLAQSDPALPIAQKAGASDYYTLAANGTAIPTDAPKKAALHQRAILPIIEHLKPIFKKTKKWIKIAFTESDLNPFLQFQQEQSKTIDYYKPFIKWTTEDKAEYILRTELDGYAVYAANNKQVPVFRKTNGLSTNHGFQVILSLQQMCKWKTVKSLWNQLHLKTLAAHKFEFKFSFCNEALRKVNNDTRSYSELTIQNWNSDHFDPGKQNRGLTKPLNELLGKQLRFRKSSDYEGEYSLDWNLEIRHLEGPLSVYVSCLWLDSNFGILPLQKKQGYNLLPVKEDANSSKGVLSLNNLNIKIPDQLTFPEEDLASAQFYLKIFLAYRKFDVSGFLAPPLLAPRPVSMEIQQASDGSRLIKRPDIEDTGQWMSFTIPIELFRDE